MVEKYIINAIFFKSLPYGGDLEGAFLAHYLHITGNIDLHL